MIEFLDANRAALVVAVTVLLFVARVLSRSDGVTIAAILPTWCDVTTWPRWAQPVVPFVLASAPGLVVDLNAGAEVLVALQAAGAAGFSAIGLYHAGKRVAVDGGKATKLTLAGLLALWLVGCAALRPAVNVVDAACSLGLRESPAVIAEAESRGLPVAELVALLCAAPAVYDAWEAAHDQRAADPGVPALRAAKAEGVLP